VLLLLSLLKPELLENWELGALSVLYWLLVRGRTVLSNSAGPLGAFCATTNRVAVVWSSGLSESGRWGKTAKDICLSLDLGDSGGE
jgi:hypothetical protein